MKDKLHASLVLAAYALILAQPALADAPAGKSDSTQAKPVASAPAEKVKARKVTPHNHMRDGKGQWVPEKKPRTENKQDSAAASQESAKPEAKK